MATQFKKSACFSDIHFGRKNNSEQHNTDCLNFIEWFCEQVKNDPKIDHIVFLGDWFEHRNAINIQTLNIAFRAMEMLDKLNLPIYFLVGNHDLYFRYLRTTHSVIFSQKFENFNVVDEPTQIEDVMFLPYIFHEEYVTLRNQINESKVVYGHLELKGFVLTGEYNVLENGPDHTEFNKPVKIFSGHFHKRQLRDNIVYIGNTFPMDFSDANDTDRGMMVYDYGTDTMTFTAWPDAPTFIQTSLSKLAEGELILPKNATVKCLADIELTLVESNKLRESYITSNQLREFTLEEPSSTDIIEDTDMDIGGLELESTDNIVVNLLGRITNESKIKPEVLIDIYKGLK